MPTIIPVSSKKYNELKSANSAKLIAQYNVVKEVVDVDGISYCITAVQQGFVIGFRMVMLSAYTGTLEPLTWTHHHIAIKNKERPNSFDGLMIRYRKGFAVLVGEYVRFELHNKKLEQLQLFK